MTIRVVAVIGIAFCLQAASGRAQDIIWGTQFGTIANDDIRHLTGDASGGLYTVGVTQGDLGGPRAGRVDSFISRVDPATGQNLWLRQTGTDGPDTQFYSVASDGRGGVYAVGETHGDFAAPNAGSSDAILVKYSDAGTFLWSRQFGTSVFDRVADVAADPFGNVYLAGYTRGSLDGPSIGGFDAFVAKYDTDGNQAWMRQFGTNEDDSLFGVAADRFGNVYVTGKSDGDFAATNLGSADGIIVKFDDDGNQLWKRQFGSDADEQSDSLAVDFDGAPIIVGSTRGDLAGPFAGGASDGFVKKYDANGDDLWSLQFGTDDDDVVGDVAVTAHGDIVLAGHTRGSLFESNSGNLDVFVLAINGLGNQLWSRQFGTENPQEGASIGVDAEGRVFVAGSTWGDFFDVNPGSPGSSDAFIAAFLDVPEPSSFALLVAAVVIIGLPSKLKDRCAEA